MTKISLLSQDTAPTTDDSIPTYDPATGQTRRVTIADLITLMGGQILATGVINPFGGFIAPTGWLLCYGQNVSRTTYATLFGVIVPTVGTFTVTIASPAVATLASHGLQTGDAVYLTSTGSLPTGLSQNTIYYAIRIDANTFNLATSRANAYAATKINTSGTQSGVHTLKYCPYGLGDGSTTFTIPDARGRSLAGNDFMGGTAASRLTNPSTTVGGVYGNQGASGGEQAHVITIAELANHGHNLSGAVYNNSDTPTTGSSNGVRLNATANQNFPQPNAAGSDTAHNTVSPTLVVNAIIKT